MTCAGLPKDTVRLLSAWNKNSNKPWFDEHRDDYEAGFVDFVAKHFCAVLPLHACLKRMGT